jgi:hypothetical protein
MKKLLLRNDIAEIIKSAYPQILMNMGMTVNLYEALKLVIDTVLDIYVASRFSIVNFVGIDTEEDEIAQSFVDYIFPRFIEYKNIIQEVYDKQTGNVAGGADENVSYGGTTQLSSMLNNEDSPIYSSAGAITSPTFKAQTDSLNERDLTEKRNSVEDRIKYYNFINKFPTIYQIVVSILSMGIYEFSVIF